MHNALYEGKSKTIHPGEDESSLCIRFKDTATAFNGEKIAELPGKGKLNAAISNRIFAYLAAQGIRTHFIRALDETAIYVRKADIILVEVIVRNIAAGGFSKKYGVAEGTPLPNTVVEFCYKSDALGDPMLNDSQIMALGLASADELKVLTHQALRINTLLDAYFAKGGIRLVDFKLEFGRCDGEILLCDEISPDSCRLWDAETDEILDKDRFRRGLDNVLGGYQTVLGRLLNVC